MKTIAFAGVKSRIRTCLTLLGCILVCASTGVSRAQTQRVIVPNGSFELPTTTFADPRIDAWQKTPKPDWFDESRGTWDQLSGVFLNTAPGASDHIDNVEGAQAAFLFSVPTAGVFQELTNATFQAGHGYRLTVGLLGGGGNMPEGATILLGLYYRDAASNMVTIASTTVTNTKALFPTNSHFVDFSVELTNILADQPAAGKNIGVQIIATPSPELAAGGGYWDLENVRVLSSTIPNWSFESPTTTFADPRLDAWRKTPKPDWFDESRGTWDQLSGVFLNTAPGASDHIDNIEGSQASFLFSVPTAGFYQDLSSTFEAGNSYRLTAGFIGGGGNMPEGATLLLGLYYRDLASNMVTIAATTITNTKAVFPAATHFIDFSTDLSTVQSSNAWAGKNIGVEIIATPSPELAAGGGYWDIDNIRLGPPVPENAFSLTFSRTGTDLRIAWPSATGYEYQVRHSDDLKSWSNLDAPLAGTGAELSKVVSTTGGAHGFYSVLANPKP